MGRRSITDRRMGYAWMIVPILPIVLATAVGAAVFGVVISAISKMGTIPQPQNAQSALTPVMAGVFAVYGLSIFGFFIVLLFGAAAFYFMVDRRNQHFARQQLLFSSLHSYLLGSAKTGSSNSISRLRYFSDDSVFGERHRPAGVWAILFLFVAPIAGLALPYDLTRDLSFHEELQIKYQTTLVDALREAGYQPPTFPPSKLHKREPLFFVILSAITAGLFWIYWFYTLLKDFNDHFADQARFEDQILLLLRPPLPAKACKNCGGSVPGNARFCPSCGTQVS